MNLTDVFGSQFPYLFSSSLAMATLLHLLSRGSGRSNSTFTASIGFFLISISALLLTLLQSSNDLALRGFALLLSFFGIALLLHNLTHIAKPSPTWPPLSVFTSAFGALIFCLWLTPPPPFIRIVIVDLCNALSLIFFAAISSQLDRTIFSISRLLFIVSAITFSILSFSRIVLLALDSQDEVTLTFFAYFYVSAGVFSIFGIGFGFVLTYVEKTQSEINARNNEYAALLDDLTAKNRQLEDINNFITHEIIRPLNTAKSAVKALLTSRSNHRVDTNTSHNSIKNLLIINEELNNAISQIQAVRDLGDIEALLENVTLSPTTVSDVIRSVESRFDVSVSVDKNVCNLNFQADIFLLDIAVSNIVENAIKYGDGPVAVAALNNEDSFLHIDVTDNGPGIPEHEWESVWNIYYRGRHTISKRKAGSGLGMFLSRKIIIAHGGSTYVVSNRPSIIRLSLPLF